MEMGALYAEILNLWKESGGHLNMQFVDIAAPSKWGSWGIKKHLNDDSARWDSIEEFNKQTPCWWKNCELRSPTQ